VNAGNAALLMRKAGNILGKMAAKKATLVV
jgi:flagellar motility protein MotE (MotC chaperone)